MPKPSSYQNTPYINRRREEYFRPVLLCFLHRLQHFRRLCKSSWPSARRLHCDIQRRREQPLCTHSVFLISISQSCTFLCLATSTCLLLYLMKVIGAKKAGDEQTATVPQVHEHMHISPALPAPQAFHDYAGPVAAEADMLAIVPQADEIFDGILNSLPEIPVANVRYSDFFDPFGDGESMDMANPLSSNNPSVNLATHFHDEKMGSCSFPYPKSGPLMWCEIQAEKLLGQTLHPPPCRELNSEIPPRWRHCCTSK